MGGQKAETESGRRGSGRIGLDLTSGSIPGLLARLVPSLLLASILQQMYNTVDMIVIGQFGGSAGTVGTSTGGEIATLILYVTFAFEGACEMYSSQLAGAGRRDAIRKVIGTALHFTMILGVIFTAVSIVFARFFLGLLKCPPEAYSEAHTYMIAVAFGLPFVFGYNSICGILRGMGEAKRPLLFVVVATVVNIALDVILVAFAHLGCLGTAMATVFAQAASFLASYFYLRHYAKDLCAERGSEPFIDGRQLGILVRLAIPLTLHTLFVHITQLICNAQINSFGIVASATNSIGVTLQRFINTFTTAVNTGAGTIVGQNIGARKPERVRRTVYITLAASLVCAGVASFISLVLPRQAYSLFSRDPGVIEYGVVYLRICVLVFVFSAVQGSFDSVIHGSGFVKLAMVKGILDGILRLIIGFFLAYRTGIGAEGFFYGNAFARVAPVTIGIVYFYSGRWMRRGLIGEKD